MSKRYTVKQMKTIMRFVALGALEHIDAIKREVQKIGKIDENTPEDLKKRAQILHLTLVCINDIIHPAHQLLYSLFDSTNHVYFDLLVKSYKESLKLGALPKCFCESCDPDGSKFQESVKELEKKNADPAEKLTTTE